MGPWIMMACLWITGTSLDGDEKQVHGQSYDEVYQTITDDSQHRRFATEPLGPVPAEDAPWDQHSDHAARLVYRGRATEAIALLEALEARHPGEYTVAANLGTAYELAGRPADARRWIAEAIERNPGAHAGTEWLHVRILDAQLALADDPAWLQTHAVLGLDFGPGARPAMPATWPAGQSFRTTYEALRYELKERMGFVKPPDPIVAELLADFASLVAMEETIEHALPIFRLALDYQPVRADPIRRRHDALADLAETRRFRSRLVRILTLYVALPALLLGVPLLVIVGRRRRLRRRAAAVTAP